MIIFASLQKMERQDIVKTMGPNTFQNISVFFGLRCAASYGSPLWMNECVNKCKFMILQYVFYNNNSFSDLLFGWKNNCPHCFNAFFRFILVNSLFFYTRNICWVSDDLLLLTIWWWQRHMQLFSPWLTHEITFTSPLGHMSTILLLLCSL